MARFEDRSDYGSTRLLRARQTCLAKYVGQPRIIIGEDEAVDCLCMFGLPFGRLGDLQKGNSAGDYRGTSTVGSVRSI